MRFNQTTYDLICKGIFIIVPIFLLTLTNFQLWQMIAILVLVAIILKMYRTERLISEGFQTELQPQCDECQNPFVIQQLANAQNEALINQPEQISIPPIIYLPQQPQIIPISEVPPLNINQVTENRKMPICQALQNAGFNSQWTHDDVRQLLMRPEGQRRIQQINNDVLKMTQLDQLTNQDIVNCYPKYIVDYVCKKTISTDNENQMCQPDQILKLQRIISEKDNLIGQLTTEIKQDMNSNLAINPNSNINVNSHTTSNTNSNMNTNPNSNTNTNTNTNTNANPNMNTNANTNNNANPNANSNTNANPNFDVSNISDLTLQDQIINETSYPENSLTAPLQTSQTINQHCNLNEIADDIRLAVEKFYSSAYEKISQQTPALSTTQLDQIKMQYTNLSDIVKDKSILEFKQLINQYQNRTKEQWRNDLIIRKTYSIRGYHVPGTDFYIPWLIFDENINCFGLTS
jgi:hypothetical protein